MAFFLAVHRDCVNGDNANGRGVRTQGQEIMRLRWRQRRRRR